MDHKPRDPRGPRAAKRLREAWAEAFRIATAVERYNRSPDRRTTWGPTGSGEAPTGRGETERGTAYGLRSPGGGTPSGREGTPIRDRAAVRRWQAQRERLEADGQGSGGGNWGTRVWIGPPDGVWEAQRRRPSGWRQREGSSHHRVVPAEFAPESEEEFDAGLRAAGWTPIGYTDGTGWERAPDDSGATDGTGTPWDGQPSTPDGVWAAVGYRRDPSCVEIYGPTDGSGQPYRRQPLEPVQAARHRAPDPGPSGWRARLRDWVARWFPWADAPGAEPAHRAASAPVVEPAGFRHGGSTVVVDCEFREEERLESGPGPARRDGHPERDPVDAGSAQPRAVDPGDGAAAGEIGRAHV